MNKERNKKIDQAIDLLIDNNTDTSSILHEGGLLKQLTKRILEKAFEADMSNHLGYDNMTAAMRIMLEMAVHKRS